MRTLTVRHLTHYRYSRPVNLGEHRMMFRPRDSHDMRLLSTALKISPQAEVRYYHDPFTNSIAIARFTAPASELKLFSAFRLEHFGTSVLRYDLEPFARSYPFVYASEEFPDLMRSIERRYPDPGRRLYDWARQFLDPSGRNDTMTLLTALNAGITAQFTYQSREEEGTQPPYMTLDRGSGTCRDFALFLMEAVRSLGLAARFVTGYIYDPSLDGGDETNSMSGSGSTHAWVQIYLPGAGWVEFDPTNNIIGGNHLIRVGVVRDPSQAIPVTGSYDGNPEDFLGLEVSVHVTTNESKNSPLRTEVEFQR